ncbi:MAG TPA: penicillin-insensitive murein endopeptidase [Aestuariivirga sp.]|nr:penicillin-insensitive murein endopeptidase [Aestuariivirga sp.]
MPSARNNPVLWLLALAALALPAFGQQALDQNGLAQLASGIPAATGSISAAAPLPDKVLNQLPAKKVFGREKSPAVNLAARAIGSYAKGCLAGARALPVNGPAWQVMRLSRNRNWGTPQLLGLLERLALDARANDGWNGLLVGDLSQPRGGPMLSGHASHQIGLDADVWLTPMPDRTLTARERETISARLVVKDRRTMDYSVWTESHARLIRRAAMMPDVARIFVHPPIKAELCRWAGGKGAWLAKVRPYFGHNYHFHIRMKCPPGMTTCKDQATPTPRDGTGCGEELAYWLGDKPWAKPRPRPHPPGWKPPPPPPPLTLSGLPAECRAVVAAP